MDASNRSKKALCRSSPVLSIFSINARLSASILLSWRSCSRSMRLCSRCLSSSRFLASLASSASLASYSRCSATSSASSPSLILLSFSISVLIRSWIILYKSSSLSSVPRKPSCSLSALPSISSSLPSSIAYLSPLSFFLSRSLSSSESALDPLELSLLLSDSPYPCLNKVLSLASTSSNSTLYCARLYGICGTDASRHCFFL